MTCRPHQFFKGFSIFQLCSSLIIPASASSSFSSSREGKKGKNLCTWKKIDVNSTSSEGIRKKFGSSGKKFKEYFPFRKKLHGKNSMLMEKTTLKNWFFNGEHAVFQC